MTEQLERQNQYYTDIINELQNRILSIDEENQATFAAFSQIMRYIYIYRNVLISFNSEFIFKKKVS